MTDFSRRSFLGKSSLAAAAAAGAVAAPSVLKGDAAEAEAAASLCVQSEEDHFFCGASGTQVILHVDHADRGEISAYVGERHVTFTDKAFVSRLKRLTA